MTVRGSWRVAWCLALAPCVSCGRAPEVAMPHASQATALQLQSPDFRHDGPLPPNATCDGDGVSPALQWSNVPAGARSLALIVDDPDAPDPAAPQRTWVHWVLYDLPADSAGLPRGVRTSQLPPGTREGRNDWDKTGFGPPCPPRGRHRYVHTLYALDVTLPDLQVPDKAALLARMQGHVLASARLVGTYERPR